MHDSPDGGRERPSRQTRPDGRTAAGITVAVVAVTSATALLDIADADMTFAALTLLLVVACVSLTGYAGGLTAALLATGALNYYFTPPLHSFRIDRADDVLALVAFVAVAVLVGTGVARLNESRHAARRSADEANLRLAALRHVVAGFETGRVLHEVGAVVVDLFALASCRLTVSAADAEVAGTGAPNGTRRFEARGLSVEATTTRPLTVEEEHSLEALVISLGIAFERNALEEAERQRHAVAELDRSRAGFLTAVTHDLRTPLATIRVATATLRQRGATLDAATRIELADAAHRETVRLERMVNGVLELTRIRGGFRPEPEAIAVTDLVRASVGRLDPEFRDVPIALDVDPSLPDLWVDPLLLQHVMVNLVDNALRYGDRDRGAVVVARRGVSGVDVSVVDHGPGIPEAERDHVFEEFVRLDRHDAQPGTGLGLAIVRALAEANGGGVSCETTPGGGATFVVSLPAITEVHP